MNINLILVFTGSLHTKQTFPPRNVMRTRREDISKNKQP